MKSVINTWCLFKVFFLITISTSILCACKEKRGIAIGVTPPDTSSESMIRKQKEIMKDESQDIDLYISRRGYKMNTTQTGLRYQINPSKIAGDSVRALDQVSIDYKVSLLTGETVYSLPHPIRLKGSLKRPMQSLFIKSKEQLQPLQTSFLLLLRALD